MKAYFGRRVTNAVEAEDLTQDVTQHADGRKIWDLLAEHTGYTAPIPEEFRKESGT